MKLTLLSGIIIVAVSGFFGYKVFTGDQRVAARLREQVQQDIELGERRSRLEESLGLLESYRRHLAPEGEALWLVRAIGKLARESDIHLTAINTQAPQQVGDFTALSVPLHFSASYHRLGSFLSRLESADSFFRVDKLDVTHLEQVEGSDEADIQLVVSTFYLPPLKL